MLRKVFNRAFPSSKAEVNYTMFLRTREVMSRTLRRDIYRLHAPGFLIKKVKPPVPDPLAVAHYSCFIRLTIYLTIERTLLITLETVA